MKNARTLSVILSYILSITPLAISVTAPATTGDATDVPDKDRQPPFTLLPFT